MSEPVRSYTVPEEEMERQRGYAAEIGALSDRPRTYHIVTYGCQMNAHDSEKIAGMLDVMGMREAPVRDEADLVVFNTCCIRDNAERRALGNVMWLREVRKKRPDVMIAVCGCMAQRPGMAEKLRKQYGFVNLVFGTANLHRFPELLLRCIRERKPVSDTDGADVIPEGLPTARLRREAAYITIMYGCDNFCSYCIVPYVRGRERSRSAGAILREAESLAADGVKEIMLLGQNVNSYGKGLPDGIDFAELLRRLDGIGIPRIRFMTSHPKDLSDRLIRAMADCRHVLPQFHLPVQSGNDEILKRMNRHYDRAGYLSRVRALREAVPGIGLSTDIIVAFPGETEAQFEDTLSLADEVRYDSAFTFIFSPRAGTKAAAMPDAVAPEIAAERIERLIALQERLQQTTLQRLTGTEEEVLVEKVSKRSGSEVSGKGLHGVSVTLPGTTEDIGGIIRCRITGLKQNTLTAERTE